MKKSFFPYGEVTAEAVLNAVREINPISSQLFQKTDDISISRLFSTIFSDVARYNTTAKEWFFYDGIVWRKDSGSMKVESFAKMFSTALLIYSATIENSDYRKWVSKFGDRGKK